MCRVTSNKVISAIYFSNMSEHILQKFIQLSVIVLVHIEIMIWAGRGILYWHTLKLQSIKFKEKMASTHGLLRFICI